MNSLRIARNSEAATERSRTGQSVTTKSGQTWTLVRRLGQGTCCDVYEAKPGVIQAETDCRETSASEKSDFDVKRVAIKFFNKHPKVCTVEALVLKLTQKITGECKQLVKLYEETEINDCKCLILELLDVDLNQLLVKNYSEGLSLPMIQKVGVDILLGLKALHQTGFVHGDLKPGNVMWSPSDDCLKIIDFTLAFHIQDKNLQEIQTESYRAPEVWKWLQNKKSTRMSTSTSSCDQIGALGTKSDIWSFGCLLLELFLGDHSWKQEVKAFSQTFFQSGINVTSRQSCSEEKSHIEVLIENFVSKEKRDKECDNAAEIASLREVIKGCLDPHTSTRWDVVKLLKHELFTKSPSERFTFRDLLLLPTSLLRLVGIVSANELQSSVELKDSEEDIVDLCQKYGKVEKCLICSEGHGKGNVFVKFESADAAQEAYGELVHKTFNGRTVLVTYFHEQDFIDQNLY